MQVEITVIHSACALRTSTSLHSEKLGEFTCASILILSPSIDCHQVENAKYHHLFLDTDLVGEKRLYLCGHQIKIAQNDHMFLDFHLVAKY